VTRGRLRISLLLVALLAAIAVASPALIRATWSARSSNPARRGVRLAARLGCFACHGPEGSAGIPDPGLGSAGVPEWGGMVWMMYVSTDDEVREFILDGVSRKRAASASAREERSRAAVRMPAYRHVVGGRDLDDLVAAFRALSGMGRPPAGEPEGRGYDLARRLRCFACHGAAGSGGLPNPGSFAGYIPGWYGPDFRDLVRDRAEFDAWVREGRSPRLAANRVAGYFLARQRLQMPAYAGLSPGDLDALWAYVGWLGGGPAGSRSPA
jgi:mono/diheme cytochrome c family protein